MVDEPAVSRDEPAVSRDEPAPRACHMVENCRGVEARRVILVFTTPQRIEPK